MDINAYLCNGSIVCSIKGDQKTHLCMLGCSTANCEMYALLDYIFIHHYVLRGSGEKFDKDKGIQGISYIQFRVVIHLFNDNFPSRPPSNITVLSVKESA